MAEDAKVGKAKTSFKHKGTSKGLGAGAGGAGKRLARSYNIRNERMFESSREE